ncbi:hypothetical protein C8J55DRAFT_532117 [Lentinula edodes]|uniref:DUF6533 domain-containing protein n=1 Tax=Lentinula lateritia TaxID=40482 RepID=A0A9W8ZPV1_9AGAR|nr:hypothetical protein C8J55DRAFT_532117 [Lentinula edodes]
MSTSLSTRTGILSDVGLVLVRAGAMGAASLLVYDYFCTLDQEIELIWSSPFGLASMIFFANRYLPFIDSALSVNINFNATLSAEECLVQARATAWLMFIGIALSEIILMLRTYAIWGRQRSMLLFLIILTVVFIIPGIIFTELALNSLQFVVFEGCRLSTANDIIYLAFCLLTAYESILAALITIQAYKHLRQTRSPWVTKLYKDGIIFYFSLLVLSCANIISALITPELGPWLEGPQRVVHSALCNRVLFLIFQGNSATMPRVHPRDAETTTEGRGLPMATLTEITDMVDM